MLGLLAVLGIAWGATVWHPTPIDDAPPVLVVQTPGLQRKAILPLVDALADQGDDVHVIAFGCDEGGAGALAAEIVKVARSLGPDVTVVAHGLGATLAMEAAPHLDARGYVLLAPVLDVWPVEATKFLAARPLGSTVDLRPTLRWHHHDLKAVLLGERPPPLSCVPRAFAADVQGWIRAGHVPLDLPAVKAPVWVAVSLGDDVAAVEAVVPATRELPVHALLRLGMDRFQPHDPDHTEMLESNVAVRLAAHAVRRLARRGTLRHE